MQEAAAVEQRAGGSVCRMRAACGSSCSKQCSSCRRQLQREGSVQEVAEGATALGGAACKRQLQRKKEKREGERGTSAVVGSESSMADDGGRRAAGGSSGVEEELRWRAAERKSCGEGQQSRAEELW